MCHHASLTHPALHSGEKLGINYLSGSRKVSPWMHCTYRREGNSIVEARIPPTCSPCHLEKETQPPPGETRLQPEEGHSNTKTGHFSFLISQTWGAPCSSGLLCGQGKPPRQREVLAGAQGLLAGVCGPHPWKDGVHGDSVEPAQSGCFPTASPNTEGFETVGTPAPAPVRVGEGGPLPGWGLAQPCRLESRGL